MNTVPQLVTATGEMHKTNMKPKPSLRIHLSSTRDKRVSFIRVGQSTPEPGLLIASSPTQVSVLPPTKPETPLDLPAVQLWSGEASGDKGNLIVGYLSHLTLLSRVRAPDNGGERVQCPAPPS